MQHEKTYKHKLKCQYSICSQEFGSNRKDAKTCSPKCRVALSRYTDDTKRIKKLQRFETSPFGYFLANQAIRANTLEVIPKSFSELQELFEIVKYSSKADGYGSSKDYAICHIHPVKSLHSVGTLHPSNLCVSDGLINSANGNALPASGFGHSILKATLNPAWRVSSETPAKKVIQQIGNYLGTALCELLVTKLGLQPTQKFQYLEKLKAYVDHPLIKDAENLEALTAQQLGKLLSAVTGKSAGFSFESWSINAGEVFMHEAARLAKYYPVLNDVRDAYVLEHPSLLESFVWYEHASAAFRKGSKAQQKMQFFFDALHGHIAEAQHSCTYRESVTLSQDVTPPQAATQFHSFSNWPDETLDIADINIYSTLSDEDYEELEILEAEFNKVIHPDLLPSIPLVFEDDDEPNFQLYQPKTKPHQTHWRF